ncbi:MAG: hypothetical protein Q8R96_19850 [Bacteroidota bacterium]|nr:hypothetical protein [Bacteroidota bacterium]
MEELKVIFLAIGLMAIVVIGLATQIIFKKNGQFPDTHIGSNKYLKSEGITCAQTEDKIEQAKVRKELKFKQISLKESESQSFC